MTRLLRAVWVLVPVLVIGLGTWALIERGVRQDRDARIVTLKARLQAVEAGLAKVDLALADQPDGSVVVVPAPIVAAGGTSSDTTPTTIAPCTSLPVIGCL